MSFKDTDEHKITLQEFLQRLKTDDKNGLTESEASFRNMQYGDNVLTPLKQSFWRLLLKRIDLFIILQWACALFSIVLCLLEQRQKVIFLYTSLSIIAVVVVRSVIDGTFKIKKDKLTERLRKVNSNSYTVIREGKKRQIDSKKLVRGDLVEIKSGDKIPADLRITKSNGLQVDNSCLTGENMPVQCQTETTSDNYFGASNIVFSETYCCEGDGQGIVISTGDNTIMASLVSLVQVGAVAQTSLHKKLIKLIGFFTILAIIVSLIVLFCSKFILSQSWLSSLLFATACLVANIPHNLSACHDVALHTAAKKLAAKNVILRNIGILDTLGFCTCLCLDKTGTLTQNKLAVEHIWLGGSVIRTVNKQKAEQQNPPVALEYDYNSQDFLELHRAAVVSSQAVFLLDEDHSENNQSSESVINSPPIESNKIQKKLLKEGQFQLVEEKENFSQEETKSSDEKKENDETNKSKYFWLHVKVQGDATESAVVRFFQPICDILKTRSTQPIASGEGGQPARMPLLGQYKYAVSIVSNPIASSYYTVYVRGAPERIWSLCTQIHKDANVSIIDEEMKIRFNKTIETLGNNGERIIAYAKLHLPEHSHPEGFKFDTTNPESFNFPLANLTFIGLISMMDSPRDEVAQTLEKCRAAGIKLVIITGDHPITATNIARQTKAIPQDGLTNLECLREFPDITSEEADAMGKIKVISGNRIGNSGGVQGHYDQNNNDSLKKWLQEEYVLFARITPSQKQDIVSAAQQLDHVVAMVGDGINDAPAILRSDIGVSMGQDSKDTVKNASEVIILKDDFSLITDCIEEGRKIHENLIKSIVYLISSNITKTVPFLVSFLFEIPIALSCPLLLLICLITDILPTIALSLEPAEKDLMARQPQPLKQTLFSSKAYTVQLLVDQLDWNSRSLFAFFATMQRYGFSTHGLFNQKLALAPSVLHCDLDLQGNCISSKIPFSSYNREAYDLGNPYLSFNQIQNMSSDQIDGYYQNSCTQDNSNSLQDMGSLKCLYFEKIDWNYNEDIQFDLRQVYAFFDHTENSLNSYGRWKTQDTIFKDCQSSHGSKLLNFFQLQKEEKNYDLSPFTFEYSNGNHQVPVCYSTDAVKYAQTSYFIAVVIINISALIACKSKRTASTWSVLNPYIVKAIILELSLALVITYVPWLHFVFLSRPVKAITWFYALPFSLALIAWTEFKKYLLKNIQPITEFNRMQRSLLQ